MVAEFFRARPIDGRSLAVQDTRGQELSQGISQLAQTYMQKNAQNRQMQEQEQMQREANVYGAAMAAQTQAEREAIIDRSIIDFDQETQLEMADWLDLPVQSQNLRAAQALQDAGYQDLIPGRGPQGASSKGFAPTPVRVQTGQDDQGNPIYETKYEAISFDPKTGQYSSQVIESAGDVLGYEEEKAASRTRGGAIGKSEGEASTVQTTAKTLSTIKKAQKQAELAGKDLTESEMKLRRMEAGLPALQDTVMQLRELSDIATYTKIGKVVDSASRELGFGATKGSTASAKYSSVVKNQVLPLLKQTFGAAFTASEGAKLEETLGDPGLSPQEKQAQLDAFIDNKIKEIDTEKRFLGQEVNDDSEYEAMKARLGI